MSKTQIILVAILFCASACSSGSRSQGGSIASPSNPNPTNPGPNPAPTPTPGSPTLFQNQPPLSPAVPGGAATYFVSPNGSDSNSGQQNAPWQSLQFAVNQLNAGDILEVMDGTFAVSQNVEVTAQGSAQSPIIIRSSSGQAIIDGQSMNGSASARDALYIVNSSHIVVHGLRVRNAPRSGIRVSLSDHITIQAARTGPNGRWGIFTDYTDDLNLLGNDCFESGTEHGIYHSNSGDRVVMRGNYCHDNAASGLQINADPALPGDGITSNALIENNVCARNGVLGGAAINLASVRDSVIQNNLLFDNLASGIVFWDDGFSPNFGSKNNTVLHNTVVFQPGEGRHCIVVRNGSTGNRIENNIFCGGRRGAFEITTDSLSGLVVDFNLVHSRDGWPIATDDASNTSYNLSDWRVLVGGAVNSQDAEPQFTNPTGGDFGLEMLSAGRDTSATGLAVDLFGGQRPHGGGLDLGAIER